MEELLLCSSYLPIGVPNWVRQIGIIKQAIKFSSAVAGNEEE
jgi:hypothetical protein